MKKTILIVLAIFATCVVFAQNSETINEKKDLSVVEVDADFFGIIIVDNMWIINNCNVEVPRKIRINYVDTDEVVFRSDFYKNDWDGTVDGEKVQDCYYILFLRAKTEDGIDIDITMPIDFIQGQKYVVKTEE